MTRFVFQNEVQVFDRDAEKQLSRQIDRFFVAHMLSKKQRCRARQSRS